MITKIPLALKFSDCPVCQLTLPLHWLTGRTRDALCAAPSPTAVGAPLSAARSCSHLQSPSCAFLRLSPYLITQFFPHHLRLLCPQLTSLTICTLITSSGWLFLVPHFPLVALNSLLQSGPLCCITWMKAEAPLYRRLQYCRVFKVEGTSETIRPE